MGKQLYTLQVTLLEGLMTEAFARANPVVSRTLEIRSHQTLNQLHRTIFDAFDRWDDCHLCEFHLGRQPRDCDAKRYVLPFVFDDPGDLGEKPAAGSITQTRLGSVNGGGKGRQWRRRREGEAPVRLNR